MLAAWRALAISVRRHIGPSHVEVWGGGATGFLHIGWGQAAGGEAELEGADFPAVRVGGARHCPLARTAVVSAAATEGALGSL